MALPSGIDTAAKINAEIAQKAKEAGQSFIGRYIVPESYSKALTKSEAKIIHDAGLSILLCWELTASRPKQGAGAGAADGKAARELAMEMQVPKSAAIYFAVDYNPAARDYPAIEQYLRAAAAAVAPYDAGVYGNYYVCEEMYLRGAVKHLWQCCGGSGKLISPHAYLYQRQGSTGKESKAVAEKIGVPVDMDTCGSLELARLWTPKTTGNWYDAAMAWAVENGICDGTRPTEPATRAEVIQMFYNLAREEKVYTDDRQLSGLLSDD